MAPLPRLRRLSSLAPLALAAALLAAACGAADEAAGDGADCEALASPVSGPAPELASAAGGWPSANRNLAGDRAALGGPIRAATAARLETAWEYALPSGDSPFGMAATNPLIANGVVYLADLSSNVHAVDLRTGERRWSATNDAPTFGPNGVAVGWGRVFASVGGDSIAAYDVGCGEPLWTADLTREGGGQVNIQPVVAGALVLAATSSLSIPGSRGVLYALDPATGETAWSFDTVESPDLWGHPDLNSGGGAWYPPAVDTASGLVYWGTARPYPFPGAEGFPNGSSRPATTAGPTRCWRWASRTGRCAGPASRSRTTSSTTTAC